MSFFRLIRDKDKVDNPGGVERFVEAHDRDYQTALAEVRAGSKQSHWIWYIFPQLKGLGQSAFAQHYGISDKDEAGRFLSHKILGTRLREITNALLLAQNKSATEIFGGLDAKKVRSSMTLFDAVCPNDIFAQVLDKYYDGRRCQITLNLLREPATIGEAIAYIGIDPADFALTNSVFTRPEHAPIHGIGHIYRTMIGCALLGQMLQKPRAGLLAFCGAYIHDLAREGDGEEPEHGARAVVRHFDKFSHLWDKYQLTEEERIWVKQAVTQHSIRERMTAEDKGYDVMAILKDADALDRCRIGDLNPRWLRYRESKKLIATIEQIYHKTHRVNEGMEFGKFVVQATH